MHPTFFRLPEGLPLVGGAEITSFGVFMFLAFLTAGFVLRSEMERVGYDGEKAWDFVFLAVIGGIVGAKLYYVLLNFDRLQQEGLSFVFSRGGMVWYGGFLGAAALIVWSIRRQKLPLGRVADLHAPALALAYAVGRVGCFMVGDDYGRPTSLPWGIRFPEGQPPTTVYHLENHFGVPVDPALIEEYGREVPALVQTYGEVGGQVLPVHPTQIYEVGISTLIFFVLWRFRRNDHGWGWLFMLWLALAGLERGFVEIFRAKDDRFFGFITLAQVISLGLVVVGLVGMERLKEPGKAQRRAEAPEG